QYRDRSGRPRACRRLYAPLGRSAGRIQRDSLRASQLQFHPRHRAGCGIMRGPNVMVVNPAVPAKTGPEFVAYAKAHPGKISMADFSVAEYARRKYTNAKT